MHSQAWEKKQELEQEKREKDSADAAQREKEKQQIAQKVALQKQDEELVNIDRFEGLGVTVIDKFYWWGIYKNNNPVPVEAISVQLLNSKIIGFGNNSNDDDVGIEKF